MPKNRAVPIRPTDLDPEKFATLPSVVIETFNEFVEAKFNAGKAVIFLKDITKTLIEKGLDPVESAGKYWTLVQETYSEAGWSVKWAQVGYDDFTLTFSPK